MAQSPTLSDFLFFNFWISFPLTPTSYSTSPELPSWISGNSPGRCLGTCELHLFTCHEYIYIFSKYWSVPGSTWKEKRLVSVGTGSEQDLLTPGVVFFCSSRKGLYSSEANQIFADIDQEKSASIVQEIELICVQQPTMVTPRETSLSLLVT